MTQIYKKNIICYQQKPLSSFYLWAIAICLLIPFNLYPRDPKNSVSVENTIAVKEKKQDDNKLKYITGVITDQKGDPIIGANVIEKGTTNGTITDIDGMFSLELPESAILQISYIGYITTSVTTAGQNTFRIKLTEDTEMLEEVVVVGYGTQKKKNVTGAIQTLDATGLNSIPVAQISQKMQGKFAGVQISQATGRPGEGINLRVRGQASISAQGQPLYVVDGFPIIGDISSINPNEIESITVLKDASSTSLYGSRAAFGVIMVETKRAGANQTHLTFNAYTGIQQVPQKGRPDMMNANEFAQFQKEVYEFNNKPVPEEYQNPEQYGKGTDWYDVLLRLAPIQDYSVNLLSSKDNFSTAVTAGYLNQKGVMINTGFERYSIRMNSEYKFTDKLKIGFNVAPTYSIYNGLVSTDGSLWDGGILMNAILSSPIAVHKNPDGTMPLTASSEGLFPNPNWYRVANELEQKRKNFKMLSNVLVQYELIKDLYLKTTMNIDMQRDIYSSFSPSTVGNIGAPPPQKATAQQKTNDYLSWLSENTINYSRTIGSHEIDFLAGFTAQRYRGDLSDIVKTDFPDDRIHTLTAGATTSYATSDIQEWSMISYLSRINYNYKNKYLLSAAIRRDGASRFGPNNKWGNFPSGSAGWVISEEEFMQKITPLSFLKLRVSYGITGNNNIGNYPYYAAINTANYVFDGTLANGRSTGSLANLYLGWERTKQVDIGVDVALLNNRINLSYDYFRKYTDGLLFQNPIPIESGFNSLMDNIGEFRFWGHEITISTRNIINNNFKWFTDLNLSFNDNKVMKLGTTNASLYGNSDITITKVGERIGQFWGFVFDGIYQNEQDLANSPRYISSEVGTVKMKDINGDGVITNTNDDKAIIGNPWATCLFGMTNNFSYKNLDLSIVVSGSIGNDILNMTQGYLENLDGVFNVTRNVARRWKSEQDPGDGYLPSVKAGTTDLARFYNSLYVTDGSHLTVKNITLGYTIPLKNKHVSNFRVYGSIQQAFVLTKYKGANPEVSGFGQDALNQGVDYTAYPVPRTFSIGLNITL